MGKRRICIYICRWCFWNSSLDLAMLAVSGEKTERLGSRGSGWNHSPWLFIHFWFWCFRKHLFESQICAWAWKAVASLFHYCLGNNNVALLTAETLEMGKFCPTHGSIYLSLQCTHTPWHTVYILAHNCILEGFKILNKKVESIYAKFVCQCLCVCVCICIVYACVCYVCVLVCLYMCACVCSPEDVDHGCLLFFSTLNFAT